VDGSFDVVADLGSWLGCYREWDAHLARFSQHELEIIMHMFGTRPVWGPSLLCLLKYL
jgi:hypothetical protein